MQTPNRQDRAAFERWTLDTATGRACAEAARAAAGENHPDPLGNLRTAYFAGIAHERYSNSGGVDAATRRLHEAIGTTPGVR